MTWERRGNGDRPETADYHAIARGIRQANRRVIVVVICVLAAIVGANGAVDLIVIGNQHHNAGIAECQNRAFDQVLNELLHDQKITAPPSC